MPDIPIPARCARRPTVGGRVVPFVSVVLADGRPVLGAVHRTKAMRCITQGLCQVCGQDLGKPLVVLVNQNGLDTAYSSEAPLHPECSAYSEKACPVLNGRRETLRQVDQHIGAACSKLRCDCGGWVDSDPSSPDTRGRAVGAWYAVWLDQYAIAVNDRREPHGLSWQGMTPLRVRPITATHEEVR